MVKNVKIVTSGNSYIDIDAYAGCIAYAHLLNLLGQKAKAVSTAVLNESITNKLQKLNIKLQSHTFNQNDEYILIDISNKKYFDKIVKEDKITCIIDHHIGFENYWKNKIGNNANIQFIGSVCTIIFELYEKHHLENKIGKDIAYLLVAAILDNTLNLKANITTPRDIRAYNKLLELYNISNEFYKEYFFDCQKNIENNLKKAILNDTKFQDINNSIPKVFSQLTIYDKSNIIKEKEFIFKLLYNLNVDYALNLICLKEGKSYILTDSQEAQNKFKRLFHKKFINSIMDLESLWLRKEIIKKSNTHKY